MEERQPKHKWREANMRTVDQHLVGYFVKRTAQIQLQAIWRFCYNLKDTDELVASHGLKHMFSLPDFTTVELIS